MIKLIKKAHLYTPDDNGIKDVLIADGRIVKISENIHIDCNSDILEVVDASSMIMIPGLIDNHVHVLGGGGEGGFKTRTPELQISDLIKGGITTVIGCLGTDGVSRTMEALIAKIYGLREEGVSAYAYSGSYRVPIKTITDSVQKDLMMIEPIIGVGEIAISDHRSSVPSINELTKLASDARVGGILSGKSGIVNIHLGDGKQMLEPLNIIKNNTDIPLSQFLPTHANRNKEVFEEAKKYALCGGYIDFTTSTVPRFLEEGEVPAAMAYKECLEYGVSPDNITFSSDGQGSLPLFDTDGEFKGLDVGSVTSLVEAVREVCKKYDIPLEKALLPVTANPARILKLRGKGKLAEGFDADLVLIDKEYRINSVIANGKWLMNNFDIVRKGTFEK